MQETSSCIINIVYIKNASDVRKINGPIVGFISDWIYLKELNKATFSGRKPLTQLFNYFTLFSVKASSCEWFVSTEYLPFDTGFHDWLSNKDALFAMLIWLFYFSIFCFTIKRRTVDVPAANVRQTAYPKSFHFAVPVFILLFTFQFMLTVHSINVWVSRVNMPHCFEDKEKSKPLFIFCSLVVCNSCSCVSACCSSNFYFHILLSCRWNRC